MKVCVFLLSEYVLPLTWCSFICLWCSSQRSGICTLTFFCCRWGTECAALQVLKITKQHEAAACKLWMRSRSANTARCDMKGDFVLDSPLVVSYLCCFVCPVHIADYNCRLSKLQVCHYMAGVKCRVHLKKYKNRLCSGLFTSPATASFLLEFTVCYKSVRQGENISRALPGHLSSFEFRHYMSTNAWFNTGSGKHAWHSVFTPLNESCKSDSLIARPGIRFRKSWDFQVAWLSSNC